MSKPAIHAMQENCEFLGQNYARGTCAHSNKIFVYGKSAVWQTIRLGVFFTSICIDGEYHGVFHHNSVILY